MRWRRFVPLCGVLAAVTLMFLLVLQVTAAAALPPGWTLRPVTSDPSDEVAINIDGSNLLYVRYAPTRETCDILLYSTGTGTTRTVADDVVLNGVPVIKGGYIAYSAARGTASEIYVWDIARATTRRVTTNFLPDVAPSLDGSRLVWQRHDGTDWEIRWIDLSSGPEHGLPNNFVDDFDPHVAGPWIAYRQEDPLGEFGEVYVKLYDVERSEQVQVTPSSDPAQDLCLSPDYLAFLCTRDFPTHQFDQVMLFDLDTRTLRALTTDLNDHSQLYMSSGWIVYVSQRRGDSASTVVLHDIATHRERALSYFEARRGRSPVVSQRWAVFQAWDGHDFEIVGYHIPTRRLFQITDDAVDNVSPRISGDRVAFTTVATPTSGDVTLASFVLPFVDVPPSSPYRPAVENLYFLGIMSGYDAIHFGLSDPLLRQQFAKVIVLTTGVSCTEADQCRFVDVEISGPGSLYPDNYVEAAAREGLTRGTSATRFSPYDHISRVQVMTMVVRAAQRFLPGGLREPPVDWSGHFAHFTDPTHGHNAQLAEYNGLLEGIALTDWDEWADATRGEVAQMLWNLWEKMNCGG